MQWDFTFARKEHQQLSDRPLGSVTFKAAGKGRSRPVTIIIPRRFCLSQCQSAGTDLVESIPSCKLKLIILAVLYTSDDHTVAAPS